MKNATTQSGTRMRTGRGLMSLINGQDLVFYEFDSHLLVQSTAALRRNCRRRRRRRRHSSDVELTGMSKHNHEHSNFTKKEAFRSTYNSSHSEWTLLFFASEFNINSIRFRPILADFCQNHRDKVQCICVPNELDMETDEEDALSLSSSSLLLQGTGFFKLPWDHGNRSALLHFLAVTVVPTLVVVSNLDGRCITDNGMADIESSHNDVARLLEQWRNHRRRGRMCGSCCRLC